MRLLFLAIYILTFLYAAQSIKFSFPLASRNMACFGENILFHSLVVGEVTNKDPNFLVRVYDPNGQLLYSRENDTVVKFSFTGQVNGTHQVCIDNYFSDTITLDFSLLTGLDAKDYSELADKQKIKPMENQLTRLESLYKLIKVFHEQRIYSSELKLQASDFLNSQLFYSTIITIVLVLVLSCFQSYYVKDFFKQKKLI